MAAGGRRRESRASEDGLRIRRGFRVSRKLTFEIGERRRAACGGSALIIVLWTLGLLSLLIGSFAFDARIEARIISYYRKRSQAVYISKSGVELAEMLLEKSGKHQKAKLKTRNRLRKRNCFTRRCCACPEDWRYGG